MSFSQILRPYASKVPVTTNTAGYRRLYSILSAKCPGHHASRAYSSLASSSRPYSTKSPKDIKDPAAEAESQTSAARSRDTDARIQKLRDLNALHYPRLVHSQGPTQLTVPRFRESYFDSSLKEDEEVLLYGRVLSVRRMSSKLVFITIEHEFQTVQVMFAFGNLPEVPVEQYKETLRALLRGDSVSVIGTAMVTPAGELTLRANRLPTLLSPGLAPIPAKLVNEETKALNRHLDLLVNPHSQQLLRFRSEMIWWLRSFFVEKGFLEVQTPILADYAGGASARPFLTSANEFQGKQLAMRIAPELWLKRLVVGGFDKIFEIGTAFRNEGLDGTHNVEFTMCEFYSTYTTLPDLMMFTTRLIRELAEYTHVIKEKKYATLQPPELQYFNRGLTSDGPGSSGYKQEEAAVISSNFEAFENLSGAEKDVPAREEILVNGTAAAASSHFKALEFIPALEEALDVKLPDLSAPDALSQLSDMISTRTDYVVSPNITLNKLLDNLAGTYLEKGSHEMPIFITHHPACMSPLAKCFTCPRTGQLVSARAELFIHGREITNFYEEENDPAEQRRKFELQVASRSGDLLGEEGQAIIDESYIQALEHGLPPTGGWGCGIDRLIMLFSGASRINDTLTFGNLRNVVSATEVVRRSG
ncbi:lysyl-tRNA synthetase- class II [Apiospora kogelbergensis]|uniref:Lysyl-tRNA synthetase n=1 Tax=Apiospora kogelbergensis TaxID=1337665 RepID=A0AAW0RDI2_9PEZI